MLGTLTTKIYYNNQCSTQMIKRKYTLCLIKFEEFLFVTFFFGRFWFYRFYYHRNFGEQNVNNFEQLRTKTKLKKLFVKNDFLN